ncbi:acyltransferase family protein [Microbacterium wangruii]|uniref:acyltransferase family protein n=1 Tax=Microbacterium wangruii TaxID=3049073 RepID=UPI00256F091A|nr:acyltransferase family protein [Microbacterium sp. zg-Y1211]MDL5488204.1 acyltransferase family protein [Microbacterium sp. zg-Y1211]
MTARALRHAGLDGLRALAVTLVVVYHLFPSWGLRSGFLGVDVFFVISGFLITSLLLRERSAHGRIRLRDFWRRRARRLLPALAVVVTVCASVAWLVGADVLVGLDWQLLGAATFSYNWASVIAGGDYFASTAPELFGNLWSLAVEEQFYLLWPLLLPLVMLLPRRWARVTVASIAAAGSAVWAAALIAGVAAATRVYFGTDTHAFGLLLGVALAFATHRVASRAADAAASTTAVALQADASDAAGRRAPRVRTDIAGTVAVVGILALAALPVFEGALTYPGVLVAASALTVAAIAAATRPGSRLGPALDMAPLRWVGERSYGLYLWHWPVVVLVAYAATGRGPDTATPPWAGAIALAVTLIAAEASYRWVETPVRRHGFRAALRELRGRLASNPRRRFSAVAALTAAAIALSGTTAALATAPAATTGGAAIEAGHAALQAAADEARQRAEDAARAEAESADAGRDADQEESTDASPEPHASGGPEADAEAPDDAGAHEAITGDQITAVGDSVMLASAPALLERYPGIAIDAAVSRSMWAGLDVLRALEDHGALRPVIVVGLGTNGSVPAEALQEMALIAGPDRRLVLVDAFAPRDWIPGVNDDLRAFARGRSNVSLATWSDAIAAHTDLLAGDGVHPGPTGADLYAATVQDAVKALDAEYPAGRERAAVRESTSSLRGRPSAQ